VPTLDSRTELSRVQQLLVEDRVSEALAVVEHLAESDDPRVRADALTYRLAALINLGRTEAYAAAMDSALEAARVHADPGRYGRLQALAAVASYRLGSLERCVTHLVRSAQSLAAVELTDTMAAWGWHNLAVAYSFTGFHGHALSAIERARKVGANIGLSPAQFDAPAIRLRLAVSLDQRGDSESCQRILRDLVNDLRAKKRAGELDTVRPITLGTYGYTIARLGALGETSALKELDPRPMLDNSGDSNPAQELRALGSVCLAIADGRPIEAVARLETANVSDETLDAAEPHRLRALAHLAAGDHVSAYEADRQAFREAYLLADRLRELFVDGMAARLDHENLRRAVAQFADEANTDPLTGLPNRRFLEHHTSDLVAKGNAASLGVCDLDRFETVNARHGHLSGDLVLQRVAGVLNRVMRRGDLVARYGDDEFAVLLPGTSLAEAHEVARRIGAAVSSEDWQALVPGTPVSVTIGWTSLGADGHTSVTEAFEAADRAMLAAKRRPA
jgi:diguanylate cyclase (GGDEF)-like protein